MIKKYFAKIKYQVGIEFNNNTFGSPNLSINIMSHNKKTNYCKKKNEILSLIYYSFIYD